MILTGLQDKQKTDCSLVSVYEKSMLIELREVGISAIAQHPIDAFHRDQLVGQFIANFLIEGNIIVELKSVRQLSTQHEVQLVNYLVATKHDVGLLINFAEDGVKVRRKVRTLP